MKQVFILLFCILCLITPMTAQDAQWIRRADGDDFPTAYGSVPQWGTWQNGADYDTLHKRVLFRCFDHIVSNYIYANASCSVDANPAATGSPFTIFAFNGLYDANVVGGTDVVVSPAQYAGVDKNCGEVGRDATPYGGTPYGGVTGGYPPSAHPYGQHAWDSSRNKWMVEGGVCDTRTPPGTWFWNGTDDSWNWISNAQPFGSETSGRAVYNPFEDRTYMFGGDGFPGRMSWLDNSTGTWSEYLPQPTGAPNWQYGNVHYIPNNHKVMVLGGCKDGSCDMALYQFNYVSGGSPDGTNSTYTQITLNGTTPCSQLNGDTLNSMPIAAYDTKRSRWIVYCGPSGGVYAVDYATKTWSELTVFGSGPSYNANSPYDASLTYSPDYDAAVFVGAPPSFQTGNQAPVVYILKFPSSTGSKSTSFGHKGKWKIR